jgi:hypothetical protein
VRFEVFIAVVWYCGNLPHEHMSVAMQQLVGFVSNVKDIVKDTQRYNHTDI